MKKTKPRSILESSLKNPVAEVFGEMLRRQRSISGRSSEEIADLIGIGRSYYRLVESGSNNLHISKAIKLVSAFEDVYKFDAVSKLLLAISYMEVTANKFIQEAKDNKENVAVAYSNGLMKASEELSQYDERLKIIFKKFHSLDFFSIKEKEVERKDDSKLSNKDIIALMLEYLTNYDNFGKATEIAHNEFIRSYLNDVPAFYLEYLTRHKEQLLKMPIRINFSELWRWEEENKNSLRKMICVIKNHRFVFSSENLSKYKYKHLWAPQYEEVLFIVNSDARKASVYKAEFKKLLKQSLTESGEFELLDTIDEKMRKVHVKCYPFNSNQNALIEEKLTEIFELKQFNELSKNMDNPEPGAVWVHNLENYGVGFFALAEKDTSRLVEGVGLTLNEVAAKTQDFYDMWALIS